MDKQEFHRLICGLLSPWTRLQAPELTPGLPPTHDAYLPDCLAALRGLGDRLSPAHLRCPPPRPVSCYALFEGWLLLSPPPGCLRGRTPFWLHLAGT